MTCLRRTTREIVRGYAGQVWGNLRGGEDGVGGGKRDRVALTSRVENIFAINLYLDLIGK